MPFEIVRNDLSNMKVDAIVNAANPRPVIGHGVDSAIHHKAGAQLLHARKAIGDIAFGDAALTPAFDLDAAYVIHAVSPIWGGGKNNECILLEHCYERSLQLAMEYGCHSIAFPLLAAGNHGFPEDLALQIAVNVFSKFLMKHEMQVYLVVFDKSVFTLSEKLFRSVQSFIDETYIQEKSFEEYGVEYTDLDCDIERLQRREGIARRRQIELEYQAVSELNLEKAAAPLTCFVLEDMMKEVDETFSENLIRLIDQKGLKDPDVYKKANINRKLFSKIKNNKEYKPSKPTAIAFAIALELSFDETCAFIGRAGYAMTHSSKFDIIIEYFLLNKNYNIFEINEVLFAFDQPLIGG